MSAKNDSISKPMENYNKNSNFQEICNKSCERLIETYLTKKYNQEQFNILDLGCSHGKNSMIIVNKILDQLASNGSSIGKIGVIHEDLPDNDYDEVLKCVNDPKIGYINHSLASKSTIVPHTVGISYYENVKPKEVDCIDIGFSLNTLVWLPSKPCRVSKGLFPNSRNLTASDKQLFSDYAHELLVKFFNLRYEEMRSGALLICNVHGKLNVFDAEDEAWDEHLKSNNFTNETFKDLIMPIYMRSEQELHSSLDQVKDKFEVIHLKEETYGDPTFSKDTLKAALRLQIISGLKAYEDKFSGEEELAKFVDEFFDKMGVWLQTNEVVASNYWVVLKKL
ncbi:S-adenosyl-L-methionine-dependent methyltransferase [Conidiobolus coronatus NRRL 28638]|uniref:S-adenosyl-L-methionine-dependent methyltransferase n=1 Tax=Conidiobolus coronatus (strain ATCC 28846 / CBS 209.66 / NRRL 28638) TaxID=796925 RepID=A0A137NTY2_CONC2|nr:S-adenosyl-L-methionine-dependent methyltransferase [Conidiobolus coronatus NRRL 28638]|eukprot:KXN66199.1 S-adenosyl-L-methionine-dependent methyltransferase [Conidiobolus coronatus NRRL 28638]